MRIALVSPYSWTYPGGVTRHIEALAEQFLAERPRRARARALRPATTACRARLHRGARPAGARAARLARPARAHDRHPVQRRRLEPRAHAVRASRRCAASCAPGGFDVVHVHEPVAPVVGWDALTRRAAPLVGTFHCYSENAISQQRSPTLLGRARASSTACTCASPSPRPPPGPGRRFYGGRYRVIPNGVDAARRELPRAAPRAGGRAAADRVRRPGRRAQGPARAAARLRGAARARPGRARRSSAPTADEVAPLLLDDARRRRALGQGRRRRASTRALRARRRAVRAVARRRELRHGPDRGVRGRHAGRRLRHRRLPRRRARRRRRRARPARRRHRARRDAARPRAGARAPRARWPSRPRAHAPRYAWPRVAAEVARGLRGRRRHAARRRPPASAPACSSAPCRPTSGRARPAARRLPSLEAVQAARAAIAAARPRRRPRSASPGSPPRCWPCSRCSASAWTRSATACCAPTPDLGAARPRR